MLNEDPSAYASYYAWLLGKRHGTCTDLKFIKGQGQDPGAYWCCWNPSPLFHSAFCTLPFLSLSTQFHPLLIVHLPQRLTCLSTGKPLQKYSRDSATICGGDPEMATSFMRFANLKAMWALCTCKTAKPSLDLALRLSDIMLQRFHWNARKEGFVLLKEWGREAKAEEGTWSE